ncbi:sulfatase [Halorubrum coriense DSM 10284]|uniref:Sulfatase n=1 Tax=Halorubrum coriense DSM 10284 TaxID=1227466 RepID=M0EAU0_9EURY|nr:sulfatase-like hydrolase/transferase [Halorubrum coriense]ELZ44926.1 sulfatase [Halorubrum coriense DSM 10284]
MSRNVVLLVLDSVRKDVFDEYASRIQSKSSISAAQCRAASSWSVPSHASILTGKLPHEHGVHTFNRDMESLLSQETICDRLDAYHTLGVSANVYAGPAYGFDSIFDEFVEVPRYQKFPEALNATTFYNESNAEGLQLYQEFLSASLDNGHSLKSLANGVLAQVKQSTMGTRFPDPIDDGAKLIAKELKRRVKKSKEPVFAFANFMEAHEPFGHILGLDRSLHTAPRGWTSAGVDRWELITQPEEYEQYIQWMKELYAAHVDYLDRIIASLAEELGENTTIIVTADHGENFGAESGDDGLFVHTSSLSEGLLHVPLEILNPPESVNRNISDYVSHLQFPEIVTSIANETIPELTWSEVPAEVMGMAAGTDPPSNEEYWNRTIRCAYRESEKMEWDTEENTVCYRITEGNPNQQEEHSNDIQVPDWALNQFEVPIQDARQRALERSSEIVVDDSTSARLEDLGYL